MGTTKPIATPREVKNDSTDHRNRQDLADTNSLPRFLPIEVGLIGIAADGWSVGIVVVNILGISFLVFDIILDGMLFPYNTDAPLYHYPIATGTLIVINILFYFCFCVHLADEHSGYSRYLVDEHGNHLDISQLKEDLERRQLNGDTVDASDVATLEEFSQKRSIGQEMMLDFGKGYRPWQWLTNMFMHMGFLHLAGNMVFLWSFGLLLEGKMGSGAFSIVYLAMGIAQSIIVQSLMWFSTGSALGASGAIFALLALVVLFAPYNNFEVVLWLGLRPIFFEIPTVMFAFLYLVLNIGLFFFQGAKMGSEALHLIGFLVGIPVGLGLLLKGYVDCEGGDLISYFQGKSQEEATVGVASRKARESAKRISAMAEQPSQDPVKVQALLHQQVTLALDEEKVDLAIALQRKQSANYPGMTWNQADLARIIELLMQKKEYAKVEPLIEEHILLFERHRFRLQATLIRLWLHGQRPRHAYRYLQQINLQLLSEAERTEMLKFANHAKKQIAEGVLEIEV